MPRRKAASRVSEADLLLANTWDIVYRHDTHGVMTYVSPSVERMSGYTPKEWMRHYSTFMTANPLNEKVREYTEDTLRTGRRHPPYLVEIRRKDGTTALLEVSEHAYRRRGRIVGIIGVARDVTEREHAGAELQRLVGQLMRYNQDLAEFASFASHDLQAPVRKIAVFAEMLQRAHAGCLEESSRAALDAIIRNAAQMQALVRSLLEYSHAGQEDVPHVPVELDSVVPMVLEAVGREASEAGAKIVVGALPVVRGDPLQLRRVLVNLVSNALKYRGEASPEVFVEARRDWPNWLLSVQDNGVGIPAQHLEEVFLPFRRLGGGEGPPGSGIGLAICRRIVERHGGRIWAERSPGGGTAIHFTLPAA